VQDRLREFGVGPALVAGMAVWAKNLLIECKHFHSYFLSKILSLGLVAQLGANEYT
jgi:hypothetical protein